MAALCKLSIPDDPASKVTVVVGMLAAFLEESRVKNQETGSFESFDYAAVVCW